MNAFISTSYVSRVCAVPPLVAQAGLHALSTRRPVLVGDGWELRMAAAGRSGVLMAGWPQRVNVAIEIEPWSRSRTLLGIRHGSRAVPWWSDTYFTCAHDAITSVQSFVTEWADEPLRALLAADREHTSSVDHDRSPVDRG